MATRTRALALTLVALFSCGFIGVLSAEDIRLNDCEIRGADSFGDYHHMYRWPPGEGTPIPFAWGQFEHDGDGFCHITSNTFSAQIEYQALTPKAYLELKTYHTDGEEDSVILELTPSSESDDDWKSFTRTFASVQDVEEIPLPFPAAGVHFRLREHCGTKQVLKENGSFANVGIGDSNARFKVVSIGFAYGNWAANWENMDFHPGDAQDNFDNVTLEHERATDYIEFTTQESGLCTLQAYCRRKQGEDGNLRIKVNGEVKASASVTSTEFGWVDLWTGELSGGETIRIENDEWEESSWFGLVTTLHKSCVEFAHPSRTEPVFRVVAQGQGTVQPPPPPPPPPADTTPPVLQNVSAGPVSHEAAVVHFDADEDVQWRVEYGPTSAYGQVSLYRGFDDTHAASLTGLSPTTTYHFRIVATDRGGNTTVSPDQTFTTNAAPDRTPPTITNVTASVTHNSATVTWNTNEPANSKLYYGQQPATATWRGLPEFVTSHSVTVTGLLPNTQYFYWVKGSDATGNEGISPQATFTTAPAPDTAAPLILTGAVMDITQTSARITWRTNEPATSEVLYGTTPAYGLQASVDGLRTEHALDVSPLQPNQGYHYQIRTVDAAGNLTVQNGSFQTMPPNEGIIAGTVTRADNGASLAGVSVSIVNAGNLAAKTATNGSYSIAAVPTGNQTVRFTAPGYRSVDARVTVQQMRTATRDMTLVPVGTIYGYVRKEAPPPKSSKGRMPHMSGLNDAEVRLMPGNRTTQTSRGYFAKPGTPADGYYAFEDVPMGTHTLRVTLAGFAPQSVTVSVTAPGQVVRQDVTLARAVQDLSTSCADFTLNPDGLTAGQRTTLSCIVENQGNVEIQTVRVRFLWEGAQIGERVSSIVAPGAKQMVTYPWVVPADATGTGTLTAVVDPENAIAEANESNNTATRDVTITPLKPDLSILPADVTHTPANPGCGQSITVRAVVKNMGISTADDIDIVLKRGDAVLSTRSRSSLDPGEHYQASMSWTIPAGTYAPAPLSVVVDPTNSIDELDESNNQAEHVIVPAKPDLSVVAEEITSSPAAPLAGEHVRLTIKVRNLGGSKAYNIPLRVLRGVEVLGEQTISSVSAGSSITRYFSWDIPETAGNAEKLGIVVDPANTVPESNEDNNAAPHLVLVTPRRIDLFISAADITHSPSSPEAGHTATISVNVHNGGNVKASQVRVRFYRGNAQIGEKTISSISAGADYTTKLYWSVPDTLTGAVTLEVRVDPADAIDETIETNNTATHSLTIVPD